MFNRLIHYMKGVEIMFNKIFTLFASLVLLASFISVGLAADVTFKGKLTAVEGKNLTVKSESGEELQIIASGKRTTVMKGKEKIERDALQVGMSVTVVYDDSDEKGRATSITVK